MRENLFLFTGKNEYFLFEELRRWKHGFRMKHGDENLLELVASKETARSLMEAVSAMPFIAEKRLIIIDGIPRLTREEMERVLATIHDAAIVVFAESEPDKRIASLKVLKEQATEKEFAAMNERTLLEWTTQKLREAKLTADPSVISLLIDLTGSDPRMIAGEIGKLALASPNGTIDASLVNDLTMPSGERVVWGLTNLLSRGQKDEALVFLWDQLDRGENAMSLFAILIDFLRKVVAVFGCSSLGMDKARIASELKMHPFVVQNMLPLARLLDLSTAAALTRLAADHEIALKTGLLKGTTDTSEEVIAASEQLILACG